MSSLPPLKIVDIIKHKTAYRYQWFYVLNRTPVFKYVRDGSMLLATDGFIHSAYRYGKPTAGFKAFSGREFDIQMLDGSVEKANGQWWDTQHPIINTGEYISFAYSTAERLKKCNVFFGGSVAAKSVIKEARGRIRVSVDYYKYDASRDFGKHSKHLKFMEKHADNLVKEFGEAGLTITKLKERTKSLKRSLVMSSTEIGFEEGERCNRGGCRELIKLDDELGSYCPECGIPDDLYGFNSDHCLSVYDYYC